MPMLAIACHIVCCWNPLRRWNSSWKLHWNYTCTCMLPFSSRHSLARCIYSNLCSYDFFWSALNWSITIEEKTNQKSRPCTKWFYYAKVNETTSKWPGGIVALLVLRCAASKWNESINGCEYLKKFFRKFIVWLVHFKELINTLHPSISFETFAFSSMNGMWQANNIKR